MKNKFAKWKPYIFLAVLLASLVPLVWLGRYNYPTGDDYYIDTEATMIWQQTRRLLLRCGDSSGLAADREHHTNA